MAHLYSTSSGERTEQGPFLILLFILLSIIILTCLAYHYRDELKLSQMLEDIKEQLLLPGRISIKFDVHAGIDDQNLNIKFLVPCNDLSEKKRIQKRLPRIRHEMLMTMSRPEVIDAIKHHDFKQIKIYFLDVINNFSNEKIEKIYLELFFIN